MNLRNVLAMILVVLAFGVGLSSWLGNDINLIWSQYLLEVQSLQRGLHQNLSAALRAIDAQGFEASLTLIGLSFFYGIFHAAGPGHGRGSPGMRPGRPTARSQWLHRGAPCAGFLRVANRDL